MNLVQRLREKKGWSQEDAAEHSGINKRTIQRIEAGLHQPTPLTARMLAEALGTDPEAILNWAGLRHRFRASVATWQQRRPTEEELRGLPTELGPAYAAYHDVREEMNADIEALARLNDDRERAHAEWFALSDDSADWQVCRDAVVAGDDQQLAAAFASMRTRRELRAQASAQLDAVRDEFVQIYARSHEQNCAIGEAAMTLDRIFDRHDVFDTGAPVSPPGLD